MLETGMEKSGVRPIGLGPVLHGSTEWDRDRSAIGLTDWSSHTWGRAYNTTLYPALSNSKGFIQRDSTKHKFALGVIGASPPAAGPSKPRNISGLLKVKAPSKPKPNPPRPNPPQPTQPKPIEPKLTPPVSPRIRIIPGPRNPNVTGRARVLQLTPPPPASTAPASLPSAPVHK
jgi:hypothetical protein